MNTEQLTETWLQYTHLDKLYGYLPGMRDAMPAVFGLTPQEYEDVVARFTARAQAEAERLLADTAFATTVDRLPFTEGQTVLAVGDSITDDLQSWAEILRHVLRQCRPGVRLVNGGLSAHTSTMVLRRWPATVAATKPDWVLCGLGGNDVTRIGPEPNTPQLAPADTVANLRRMRELAPAARWAWLTPVPVDEDRVAEFPAFRFGGSSWRNKDIDAVAEGVRGLPGPVADLVSEFGTPPAPELQGPDGVHPTLAGQSVITRAVVAALGS